MKKIAVLILLSVSALHSQSQPKQNEDETAIKAILNKQVVAWNEANIDEFMKGYWKSDSILFIGRKITSGWDSTLIRYKKNYPDKAAMGKLRFEILRLDFASANACLVTGRYFLTREKDNPSGIFTLLFKKKKGQWVIVYDHTS
jgi:hypothetical protein